MFLAVGKVVVYVSVVFDWLVINCVVLTAGRDVVFNSDVVFTGRCVVLGCVVLSEAVMVSTVVTF